MLLCKDVRPLHIAIPAEDVLRCGLAKVKITPAEVFGKVFRLRLRRVSDHGSPIADPPNSETLSIF